MGATGDASGPARGPEPPAPLGAGGPGGPEGEAPARGWLARLAAGLTKTRQQLADGIRQALAGHTAWDPAVYDGLEEALLAADVGVHVAGRLMEDLRRDAAGSAPDPASVAALLRRRLAAELAGAAGGLALRSAGEGPTVVLFVGVNGVGKTTTVAKVAHHLHSTGRSAILAAADTFRAAGVEQLVAWGGRLGIDVVHHGSGADPAAVVFDAVQAARARGIDVVLADTAGRLHTRVNLMEELRKVVRVAGRAEPGAPHEVLLVVDGVTGQNGLAQARSFAEAVPLTGLVVTKLDGTARGGMVLAIHADLGLPVKFIGVGEGADDLRPFDPDAFAAALLPPV